MPISSFSISAGRVGPLLYQAAAYYYHGLILDKGSEPSCHVSGVCCFLAAEGLLLESKKACLSFCLASPVTRLVAFIVLKLSICCFDYISSKLEYLAFICLFSKRSRTLRALKRSFQTCSA